MSLRAGVYVCLRCGGKFGPEQILTEERVRAGVRQAVVGCVHCIATGGAHGVQRLVQSCELPSVCRVKEAAEVAALAASIGPA